MNQQAFDPDAYLDRIQLDRVANPTEDALESLHRAQAFSIPFENFDILLGRGISLEPAKLFDKLVNHTRGGYCFELNGLFLAALTHFGFEARPLLARVHISGTPSGRGHQLQLVTIKGRDFIADAGFGGSGLCTPIPFELNRTSSQGGQMYRLVESDPFGIMLQSSRNETWTNLYSFDLSHVLPQDIAYGNHFTSTSPDSFFTFARVASLPRENARVTLYDLDLKILTRDGERIEQLQEGEPFLDALRTHFGIELDEPYESLRPLAR